MKTAKNVLTALLALLLILPLFVSCGGTPGQTTPGGTPKTALLRDNRVIGIQNFVVCGDYIFLGGSTARRWNTVTGEIVGACRDPECRGDCPLESGRCTLIQVADGKLFFCAHMIKEPHMGMHPVRVGYQDLLTGEVKILLESSYVEQLSPISVYGGKLYYTRWLMRQGAEDVGGEAALDPDNYEQHLCRVSVESGREEVLRAAPDETFVIVSDGYFVTYSKEDNVMYSYGEDFRERTVLLDFGAQGLRASPHGNYLDGKLYFGVSRDAVDDGAAESSLCSFDLASGTLTPLLEKKLSRWYLTEDAIWYFLADEMRWIFPEGWEEMTEEEREDDPPQFDDTVLYTCDLDGKNGRAVWKNAARRFLDHIAVTDGMLYGEVNENNERYKATDVAVDHTNGLSVSAGQTEHYFCAIDFAANTVTDVETGALHENAATLMLAFDEYAPPTSSEGDRFALEEVYDEATDRRGYCIVGPGAFKKELFLDLSKLEDDLPYLWDGGSGLRGMKNLVMLTLPGGFLEIRVGFADCPLLTTVRIPASVRKIGSSDGIGIFAGCPELSFVFYGGTVEEWNAIEKTEGWNDGAAHFTVLCDDGSVAY